MRNSALIGMGVAASVLLVSGCGQPAQAPTAPTAVSAVQTASGVSQLTSPEVPIFNVQSAGTSSEPLGPCVFDQGLARFGCGNVSQNGLSFTRTVTFYDANGVVQTAFDPVTTASVKTETSVSGTTMRDGRSVTVSRTGQMVVSGLAGAETTRTMNGTEQGTVAATGSAGGVSVTINTTVNDATTNLVVPVPSKTTARGYPLSGSRSHATTTVTTRGADTKTESLQRVETFDGTATVQVRLTINGVTQNCTANLADHTTTCKR